MRPFAAIARFDFIYAVPDPGKFDRGATNVPALLRHCPADSPDDLIGYFKCATLDEEEVQTR